MRFRCRGYTEGGLSSLDPLRSLLRDVENGIIERPEIEIDVDDDEAILLLCALFRSGPACVGWLVNSYDAVARARWVYCDPDSGASMSCEEVFLCGALERIDRTAILNASQVVGLIERIAERSGSEPLIRRRFFDVVTRG